MTRRTVALVALAAVLAVVVWFFLLYSPKRTELAEVEDQIAQAVQRQDQTRGRIEQLEEVRNQAPEIEARLAAAEAVIPRDPALPSTLRQLQLAADDSGVTLLTVAPGRPEAAGLEDAPADLARIALTVTLEGGYFQIVDFLRRVEDPAVLPRGIVWTSTALSVADYPTLSASVSGHMYARLRPPAAPAPAESPSPEPTDGGGGG